MLQETPEYARIDRADPVVFVKDDLCFFYIDFLPYQLGLQNHFAQLDHLEDAHSTQQYDGINQGQVKLNSDPYQSESRKLAPHLQTCQDAPTKITNQDLNGKFLNQIPGHLPDRQTCGAQYSQFNSALLD